MADLSVKSTGSYVTGAVIASSVAAIDWASFTIVTAIRVTDQPANSVYRAAFNPRAINTNATNTSDSTILFQYPPNDTSGDLVIEFKTGNQNTGAATVDNSIGSYASLTGKWIHCAYTKVNSTGAQSLYLLTEGFNPASPTFLHTTTLAAFTNSIFNALNFFIDSVADNDIATNMEIARLIMSPLAATQAQVIAQFQQRAPTAAFTGAGNYILFPLTDHTNPALQTGTYSYVGTNSGSSFVGSASQPSEWNPQQVTNGIFFGSGTTS